MNFMMMVFIKGGNQGVMMMVFIKGGSQVVFIIKGSGQVVFFFEGESLSLLSLSVIFVLDILCVVLMVWYVVFCVKV